MKDKPATIPIIALCSDFLAEEEKKSILFKYQEHFRDNGLELVSKTINMPVGQHAFFIMTGGTEQAFVELFQSSGAREPDQAIILYAHPAINSLPAALEILAYLKSQGHKGEIIMLGEAHSSISESASIKDISKEGSQEGQAAKPNLEILESVYHKMKSSRMGLIGDPSDWLIASSPDIASVKNVWGPEVIPIAMKELNAEQQNLINNKANVQYQDWKVKAEAIVEPSDVDLINSEIIYQALKNLVKAHKLDSLSLRCFDLVTEQQSTGCFALSALNDEHIIAGCEGDLVSTIAMKWANLLTGEIPWMANPANIIPDDNTLLLAHCTIARNLVTNYTIRSHFESGLGTGIQGRLHQGPVTLIRIGGNKLEKRWLAEGKLVDSPSAEDLCRTQAVIRIDQKEKLKELLNNPLGNHIIMIKGHWEKLFEAYWGKYLQ